MSMSQWIRQNIRQVVLMLWLISVMAKILDLYAEMYLSIWITANADINSLQLHRNCEYAEHKDF